MLITHVHALELEVGVAFILTLPVYPMLVTDHLRGEDMDSITHWGRRHSKRPRPGLAQAQSGQRTARRWQHKARCVAVSASARGNRQLGQQGDLDTSQNFAPI